MARRYMRMMIIRSYRSYSWRGPHNRKCVAGTSDGVREQLVVKLGLIRHLDGAAGSIDGFEMGAQWWIWRNPFDKKTIHISMADRHCRICCEG